MNRRHLDPNDMQKSSLEDERITLIPIAITYVRNHPVHIPRTHLLRPNDSAIYEWVYSV